MHKETQRAHAGTLREWASLWEQVARSGKPGASEVAFTLGRVAVLIDRIANDEPFVPPAPEPKAPDQDAELRPDDAAA